MLASGLLCLIHCDSADGGGAEDTNPAPISKSCSR